MPSEVPSFGNMSSSLSLIFKITSLSLMLKMTESGVDDDNERLEAIVGEVICIDGSLGALEEVGEAEAEEAGDAEAEREDDRFDVTEGTSSLGISCRVFLGGEQKK